MNNGYLDRVSQRDRELEELLCLAYLFTHSIYDESPEECEVLLADDTELCPDYFCN